MNPATLSSSRLNPNLPKWQPATWEDYLAYCAAENSESSRAFYHQGYLWIDSGNEGIDHARVNNLFAMLFFLWFSQRGQIWDDLGGCVLEKPPQQGAAPDRLVYIGAGSPQWQAGERRRINLDIWRVPDLVGEVSDTTLATDLDEKKQLYAALKIPEYWAIDIQGKRVIAFCLQENNKYEQVNFSVALEGLPIALLSQTLERLTHETNGTAAQWFLNRLLIFRKPAPSRVGLYGQSLPPQAIGSKRLFTAGFRMMIQRFKMRSLVGFSLVLLVPLASCIGTGLEETQAVTHEMNMEQRSERVTLSGVVIKKPWTKNTESWNAGGGDYYVLDVGDAQVRDRSAEEGVILRPSDAVSMAQFEEFVGRSVEVSGEYIAAQPYVPESPMESYPTDMEGNPLPRGSGFKVYQITPVP